MIITQRPSSWFFVVLITLAFNSNIHYMLVSTIAGEDTVAFDIRCSGEAVGMALHSAERWLMIVKGCRSSTCNIKRLENDSQS